MGVVEIWGGIWRNGRNLEGEEESRREGWKVGEENSLFWMWRCCREWVTWRWCCHPRNRVFIEVLFLLIFVLF